MARPSSWPLQDTVSVSEPRACDVRNAIYKYKSGLAALRVKRTIASTTSLCVQASRNGGGNRFFHRRQLETGRRASLGTKSASKCNQVLPFPHTLLAPGTIQLIAGTVPMWEMNIRTNVRFMARGTPIPGYSSLPPDLRPDDYAVQ